MPKAIRVYEYGGPEVMRFEDVPLAEPGPGQIRVKQAAIGVNFIDIYFRTGAYKSPHMPYTPGKEGAGTVTAVGEGVSQFKPGDRVAYGSVADGCYAEEPVIPASAAVPIPDGVDEKTAAAMMLKGLTVEYLLHRTYAVKPGDTILWQAAAGGVGLIACQWAKALGLQLIGTAGSDAKCRMALEHGAAHAINYSTEDFAARVKEITGGKGVKVVYDSVGKDTFEGSLACLRPFGLLASFGNGSGPVPPVNIGTLGAKGSLYITRPTLFTHIATRESTQAMADDLFAVVESGQVAIPIDQRYALEDVQQAHRDLEARKTTGCTVLTLA